MFALLSSSKPASCIERQRVSNTRGAKDEVRQEPTLHCHQPGKPPERAISMHIYERTVAGILHLS